MNKEIKEILDRIETASEIFDCLLKPEECSTLLDYITNIQQEKEHISKVRDEIVEKYNELEQENAMLRQSDKNTYETSQEMLAELSKENERLKEKLEIRRKICLKAVKREQDYKSRCEKAIEMLKEIHKILPGTYNQLLIEITETINMLQNGSDK